MKQRIKIGSFIKIDLGNELFAYGRILPKASYAIYNVITKNKVLAVSDLEGREVLFILSVYDFAVKDGRWKIIGYLNLEKNLEVLPLNFIQDKLDPNVFQLYDPNTGAISPAKKEECVGLESAAVWEPEHVEQRILDHYYKRPNVWVEKLRIK